MIVRAPLSGLEFHHIGIACRNLDAEAASYGLIGYAAEGEDFEDPIQGIAGRFLTGPGPRLELVRPLGGEDGILAGVLQGGIKMYHLAFTTADMGAAIEEAGRQRAKLVVEPVPAVAFGGRHIAFLFLRNMMLIELIER